MVDRTESETMAEAVRKNREGDERRHMGPSGSEFEEYKGGGQEIDKPSYSEPVHEPGTNKSIEDAFTSRTEKAVKYVHDVLTSKVVKGAGLSALGVTALEESGATGTEIVSSLAAQYPEAGVGAAALALYSAADEFGLQETIYGIHEHVFDDPEYLEFEDHFEELEEIEPEIEEPEEIEPEREIEIYDP